MKKWIYRLITGLLLLAWLCVIYQFSAQPAAESEEISGSVSYRVVEAYCQIFDSEIAEDSILAWAERIEYPIRKAAHMTEYAILAILTGICICGYRKWGKEVWYGALLFAVGYAGTDEIHQLYVSGRAGRLSDVLIDALGAVIGLFLFSMVLKLAESIAKKGCFH